tara:strand:+ start:329 stop:1156 length:828 start_codon:yes stop_codon:yes gene_type:complete
VGVHGGLPPGEKMTEDGTIAPEEFEPAVKKLSADEYEDQIKVLYEAFTSAQADLEDALATIEVLEKEIIEREIEKETQEALLSEKEVRVRELELRAVKATKKVEHLEPELEKMEEKYSREKTRVSTVFSIAEELDNDLKHAVVEMKARDDWYVDHMQIFEDLNKAIKVRYEMIERAIEAERKSQHMARAFTERMEDMVEARVSDMAEAEADAAEESTETVEVADTVEESSDEASEVPDEKSDEPTEDAAEDAAEESPSATTASATWADGDDPWAD